MVPRVEGVSQKGSHVSLRERKRGVGEGGGRRE